MKNLIYSIFIISLISSCDIIEEPYINNNGGGVDTSSNQYVKNILIEDFTGHLCQNCPDAARELEAIHDVYGAQIIGLAIHVGNTFARPYPISQTKFTYDFRSKWGEELDNFFNITDAGLPKGMINRIGYPNDHRKDKGQWLSSVGDELSKDVIFGINISSTLLTDNAEITINTDALKNTTGNYKLVVCLTENGIINWQKDGTLEDQNYIHNHVLRSVISSTWGDEVTLDSEINNGDSFEHSYSINLSDLENFNMDHSANVLFQGNGQAGDWNINNFGIVAYIYDNDNYEILQVEQISLSTK
tara:strand:- start:1462 stop:2367 length:906 start_codon:yes stop_codon:yes gene_type:complete